MATSIKIDIDVIRPSTPSAADQQRSKILWFVIANVVSVVAALGILLLLFVVPEGQGFDHALDHVRHFLRSHMGVTALAASSPFFASLLVGQYSAKRARARRARQEAEELRDRLTEERATADAMRAARRAVKH